MVLYRIISLEKSVFVLGECAIYESAANFVGEMDNKMFIMNRSKDFGSDFIGLEKVVKVSFCVIPTALAITIFH